MMAGASAASSPAQPAGGIDDHVIALPLFLGRRTARQFRRMFGGVLAISMPLALGLWAFDYLQEKNSTPRILASINLGHDVRVMAKAASQVLQGNTAQMDAVSQRAAALDPSLRAIQPDPVYARLFGVPAGEASTLTAISALAEQARLLARLTAQVPDDTRDQATLLNSLQRRTERYAESLRAANLQKPTGGRSGAEQAAWDAMAAMATRSAQWARRLESAQEVDSVLQEMPQALDAFQQDAATLAPESSPQVSALIQTALALRELVANLKAKRNAVAKSQTIPTTLDALNEQLDRHIQTLSESLRQGHADDAALLLINVLLRALALVSLVGWLYVLLASRDHQHAHTEKARREAALRMEWAEAAAEEAQKNNETNQLAIIRLMQELQDIAAGDLTKRATVSEDLTGGIADAVNYTVAELRGLVIGVQNTASRVTATTAQVDATSLVLLESSRKQLAEIRRTGESVLQLAQRVGAISTLAQTSATVARQSRTAAESGRAAVQDAIGSIDKLREHIHETSKRIKRLGESSQEIGEITSLISDITAQTNVLALNAAIQATAAGEAGRGFSGVAEEVGQLAERSAQAARRIATLVAGIQTDTQNAVGAMERSALGVVEGARLSDRAGLALTDIDRLSHDVTAHVERISDVATQESQSAGVIAKDIQSIFTLTEQNAQGTLLNAEKVRSLSTAADKLMESVARFSVG
jgi:twitching motility protein PilJ